MSKEYTRRRVLATLATGVAAVAGCFTNPRVRFLRIPGVDVSNRDTDSGTAYEVEVSHGYRAGPDEWGKFQNVELIGFNDNGTILCRKDLGTLSDRDDQFTVTVHCSGYPNYFSFLTDESPCTDRTSISVVTWHSNRTTTRRDMLCEDSLMSRVDGWEG